MPTELLFWFYFFLLNSLFFVPRYLLELKHSSFIPYKGFQEGPLKERIRFLINRYNYDIFRVSFDFLLLSLFFFFIRHHTTPQEYLYVAFPVFCVLLVYQIYYHVFESIYQLEPTFHSDSLMLKTGFQLFFRGFNWINAFIAIAIVVLFIGIYHLLGQMLVYAANMEWTIISSILSIVFSLLGIYSLVTYNYKAFGKIAFPSQSQSLYRNIKQSIATKRHLAAINFQRLVDQNPYTNYQLTQKPNIFFIVIESYGRLLYDHPDLKADYLSYMREFEARLQVKEWYTSSNLSTAPVSGGSSWISFTALLFGLSIKDQGSYLTMLHNPIMHQYPNMMRQFRALGYKTYRLVSIAGFKGMKIPWDEYKSFYAIDEWINFEDLNYKGKLYGFGPCPPDQYALNFSNEQIRTDTNPFFLFFITQNSHSPFGSPEKVVPDWKSLNTPYEGTQFSSSIFVQPKLEDYRKAIRYQLDMLTDFIEKQGTSNDLFIVVGDHQPPVFPKPDASWETPVHIISKDAQFTESLKNYGFQPGFTIENLEKGIRHEGLYSILMRTMQQQYGQVDDQLPPYFPNGRTASSS